MVLTTGAAARGPTLSEERLLWRAGHTWVGGLDEVGRGAWAGPVSVGVAVLQPGVPSRTQPRWLRDSKQLSESRREEIFDEVASWCAAWAVGHAGPEECDRCGMVEALRRASARALAALDSPPEALLVDGPRDLTARAAAPGADRRGVDRDPGAGPTVVPVVRGDARCASVAAASILAKVVRDRMMRDEAAHFPPYDFDRNKGYPSPDHQTALRGYGLSAIHRRTWRYVASLPFGTGLT
jgi:ribonuclease HII